MDVDIDRLWNGRSQAGERGKYKQVIEDQELESFVEVEEEPDDADAHDNWTEGFEVEVVSVEKNWLLYSVTFHRV